MLFQRCFNFRDYNLFVILPGDLSMRDERDNAIRKALADINHCLGPKLDLSPAKSRVHKCDRKRMRFYRKLRAFVGLVRQWQANLPGAFAALQHSCICRYLDSGVPLIRHAGKTARFELR